MGLKSHHGLIGKTMAISDWKEIGAIGFTSEVPFEFRLIRHGRPIVLPMAIASLAEWQTFEPRSSPPCYTTLYPIPGGTRGLDTDGLAVETQALLSGRPYVLFVHARY